MMLLGVVLTIGTALFVAAEFSMVALDPAQVEGRAKRKEKGAIGVLKSLRHLSTQLSGAQVGITLTTILLGYTTQNALTSLFVKFLQDIRLAASLATAIAVVVALVLVNAFSMVFGELFPKNLALAKPFEVARMVTPLQRAFTLLFKPIITVLNGLSNRVVRSLGVEPLEQLSSARSASELAAMVRHSAEAGTLDLSTATIFTRSVGLGKLCARDVMTDRRRMDSLEEGQSAEDVVELSRRTGHSRFPVLGEDADDILGLVHLRRAVAVPFAKRKNVPVTAQSLLVEALRVPETVRLAPLLVQLRAANLQMAVVVDEYGGTCGIVSLEDVVEEIVGEVADEHDLRRRGIRLEGKNKWLVDGDLRPDEIADRIDVALPDDGPYETVAGLMLVILGKIPKEGDSVKVRSHTLTVARMEGRRIEKVLIAAGGSEKARTAAKDQQNQPGKGGGSHV
ncbi:hemolysin family protein [Varibaculum vaginae]|uniref:hemolysin family protein n=1 Tax=Varibaculum vaginae TaxID=2364797 RepID=UPI000F07C382